MAQQTPDPKLIESMALRYRHDFGFLDEPQKEAIRTTMKQLWEEVVGLGFYKPTTQQTAVEWLVEQLRMQTPLYTKNEMIEIAKQMEKEQMEKAYKQPLFSDCQTFDQYYNETYGK